MAALSDIKLARELEAELQQPITLPEEIEVASFLGRGRRSFSYKGRYDNRDVVIKVYHRKYVERYKEKCNIDIAEFEFERNSVLYNIDGIRTYIAAPLKVFPLTSGFTHSFVQEFVEGITFKQLVSRLEYLPGEVLKAGYKIVQSAESNGIHDMDISVGNILVDECRGIWVPRLYDFNMLPQHTHAPNPLIALGIKTGLRRKSHRDYRSLKNWERRGKQKHWIGRN